MYWDLGWNISFGSIVNHIVTNLLPNPKVHTVHVWCKGLATLYTVPSTLKDTMSIGSGPPSFENKGTGCDTVYCGLSCMRQSVRQLAAEGEPSYFTTLSNDSNAVWSSVHTVTLSIPGKTVWN
jgi:hypothetical protein